MTYSKVQKFGHLGRQVTSAFDGIQIYAEAIGDPSKPAIVYIHGNSTSSVVMGLSFFDETLLKHFYQGRLDLRGHGLSDTVRFLPAIILDARFNDETQSSDVDAVFQGFSFEKPIFVGWSYGAVILADYITVLGDEGVRGIVIANGLTGEMSEIKKFFNHNLFSGHSDDVHATQMHRAFGLFIDALTCTYKVWIFKRKKLWDAYMNKASRSIQNLVVYRKSDKVNSPEFMDYIKERWEPSLL
ncbi:hypothetical protein M422DRAFT_60579 [Sphaerobolus stellatus SS14]|uniref:AB hydrolase-1 domain-containing protein n=1 Tax=Sphaerobolus stellatus (strain SS14) TaxID=990650 RepID=A0A0C9UAP9_SPHS4|nr:hypothetical protein M422DRAFT_60579 [Sphaerobolus stellatus SS14]